MGSFSSRDKRASGETNSNSATELKEWNPPTQYQSNIGPANNLVTADPLIRTTMGATKYLDILSHISSEMTELRDQLPYLFNGEELLLLSQEIVNNVENPTPLVHQVTALMYRMFQHSHHDNGKPGRNGKDKRSKEDALLDKLRIERQDEEIYELKKKLQITQEELATVVHERDKLRAELRKSERSAAARIVEDRGENASGIVTKESPGAQSHLVARDQQTTNNPQPQPALLSSLVTETRSQKEALRTAPPELKGRTPAETNHPAEKSEKKEEIYSAQEEIDELKKTLGGVSERTAQINQWIDKHVQFSCVIPQSAHDDKRNTPVMSQIMQRVNSQMNGCTVNVIPKPGPEIDISLGLPVILPCIIATAVKNDIKKALEEARVVIGGKVIVVIFHHRASHNSKISTPTEKCLSVRHRDLWDQCAGMVDAVFWNGAMYDCDTNHEAVKRLQQLFTWPISMESLRELKQLAN